MHHHRKGEKCGFFLAAAVKAVGMSATLLRASLAELSAVSLGHFGVRRAPNREDVFFPLGHVARELEPVSLQATAEWCLAFLHPVSLAIHGRFKGIGEPNIMITRQRSIVTVRATVLCDYQNILHVG